MIKKKKEKKDDHERRESNTGPERSKPKALTTSLPYIFLFIVISVVQAKVPIRDCTT